MKTYMPYFLLLVAFALNGCVSAKKYKHLKRQVEMQENYTATYRQLWLNTDARETRLKNKLEECQNR